MLSVPKPHLSTTWGAYLRLQIIEFSFKSQRQGYVKDISKNWMRFIVFSQNTLFICSFLCISSFKVTCHGGVFSTKETFFPFLSSSKICITYLLCNKASSEEKPQFLCNISAFIVESLIKYFFICATVSYCPPSRKGTATLPCLL